MKYLYQLWGSAGVLWHQLAHEHSAANTEDGSWICFNCGAIWKSPLFEQTGRAEIEKELLRVSSNPNDRSFYRKTLEKFVKEDSK